MIIEPPWVPEHASDSFWTLIERARGDRDKLRQLTAELSQDNLKDAYDFYMTLASYVTSTELDEDPAADLAQWIVAQGKDFYFDVYKRRIAVPLEALTDYGAGFPSTLIEVYWDRFRADLL